MIKTFLIFLILATFPLQAAERFMDDVGSEHDAARTVIPLLRGADVAGALKSLEPFVDVGTANSLTDEDSLAAVCAELHRSLSQLSGEARFDLLRTWSLPGESPRAVRALSGLVPVVGPPAEFARALGERPRSSSFPVSAIGEVRGVFSTAWSLVVAARESGRLKQLMAELGPLVDRKVPNAELLMNLARIADGRGDMSAVAESLSRRLDRIKGAVPRDGAATRSVAGGGGVVLRVEMPQADVAHKSTDSGDIVLALAALQVPALRPVGEQILAVVLVVAEGQSDIGVLPFLRRAHAAAILGGRDKGSELGCESTLDTRLKYWVPVSRGGSKSPRPEEAGQELFPGLSPVERDSTSGIGSSSQEKEPDPGRERSQGRLNWSVGAGARWLVHEEHLLSLSGSGRDALILRYPVEGEFEFECETGVGGNVPIVGELSFGGLGYRVLGSELVVTGDDGVVMGRRPCPFLRPPDLSSFNRLSIASKAGSLAMSVNLHPMSLNRGGLGVSPWIGLGSLGGSRPLFRNLKLTGQPVIPRSVRLIDDQELRGWWPRDFGDRTDSHEERMSGWRVTDGVLGTADGGATTAGSAKAGSAKEELTKDASTSDEATSAKLTTVAANPGQVLFYSRPLLDGESISYEFFYRPGGCDVSPTLGRVAFLLQPEGVRIRWLTEGAWDWTGLAADNVVTEPLHRRGPRPLPLRTDAWNRVTVARTEGAVTLSLDDVVVYQRPIDWGGDHLFGLYRNDPAAEVIVRNVVLTGDWPQTLPQEFLDNPLATIGEPLSDVDPHALNRLFREEYLAENGDAVRRRGLAMPAVARFEFLSRWILPGLDHPGFRVSGDFTPTRPSPSARELGVDDRELGGEIVSPVFDWINVAGELDRLGECRERVAAVADSEDDFQQRAKVALLLLISIEENGYLAGEMGRGKSGELNTGRSGRETRPAVANDLAWESLFGLIKKQANVEGANHWPEVLVATRGDGDSPDGLIGAELITDLVNQRMLRWQRSDLSRWHTHLAALHGEVLRQRELAATTLPLPASATELRLWIPIAAAKARTVGTGHPNLSWSRRDNRVVKVSGHDVDYLYYRLPLSGNYQIECDLVQPNLDPIAVMIGGTYVGPLGSLDGLDIGSFRGGAPPIMFQPKLTNVAKPMRYRAVIHDGVRTTYLNGRNVLTTLLPPNSDPWIAIRSPGRHRSSVENFRILGQPTVLNAVSLSSSNDLTGWLEYYEEGRWEYVDKGDEGGWIVGHSSPALAGSYSESLLRYQRPLVEAGAIEYEFFYEPGVVETSPALDRLAFLLAPSGVREHWVTDGKYGPVDVTPDNVADVPENRRGPTRLPLLVGKWNRVTLSLSGSTVGIQLNGQLVYERELEPLNQRTFGLFHYADATLARVRNVVMRGDWPKRLPGVADQELAGKTTEWVDADLPRLKSVFVHSFEKDGLPEKYFEFPSPNLLVVTTEGVRATQNSVKDPFVWDITPRFSLSGDFDIETRFSQLKLATRVQHCGILFRLLMDDPQVPAYDLWRILNETPQQLAQSARWLTQPEAPGNAMFRSDVSACEADSGRMRLARRGKTLSYLFAEGDSPTFHLFGTEEISESDTQRHGVRLQTFAFGGNTSVVWNDVTLRAERMTWFPIASPADVLLLKVVQANGSGVRTIAAPSDLGFKHVGSPQWSSDGRKIIVDMNNGGTQDSHIFVMNADGTERRDLGIGSMPSFSGDGKRITFSASGQGIMTMKSDGTDRQVIDRSGWGTQWSPDGKWIAYGKAGNITLVDVGTRKTRQLLVGDDARRYGYIYWNLAWSHDSRGVAFKGRTRAANQDELSFAEIDSPNKLHVLQAEATSTYPDISFSPDSKEVIAAIDNHDGKGYRLHSININKPGLPKLLEVIPPNESVDGVAWSPDGKSIAITVLNTAHPTDWGARQ